MNTIKAAVIALLCGVAGAQTFDSSGNGLLKGVYYFREVIWIVADTSGQLSRAISIYGNVSFDGNGNYSMTNVQAFDSSQGLLSFSTTGTYTISASGYGALASPVSTGDSVYGLVSQGIFVASSTEAGFNDLFIAAPLASPAPTNPFFHGAYTMLDMDLSSGVPTSTFDSQFQLNPDGNGNIGTVSITGRLCPNGCGTITQNNAGVKYFFSNGGANVNFQGNANTSLIFGQKYLYFSPDGNFVFGGDPQAWDMFVGVRAGTATPNFGGLYYQAGVYQDESFLASAGYGDLNTYYGSFKANNGVLLAHERLLSLFNNNPLDYTYSDTYTLNADGTYDDTDFHYIFGAGGAIRIGIGKSALLGINVAVQAPSFPPSGVFIDPTGVVNAASSAPFTSGLAPGEFISIYGTNLAPSTQADSTFPLQLNGVQVLINGNAVPVYVVSANQISALVPFAVGSTIAAIQVVNNGVASNTVTEYVNLTAPGVFTVPSGGIGYAAALHPDGSLITTDKPAQIGEVVAMFVTGLGTVNPAISDGTPGPTDTLSNATNTISVFIGGSPATVSFAGLAPQLIGLYQINAQVPAGLSAGDAYVDVTGPDYYSSQAKLPIGTGGSAGAAAAQPARRIPSRLTSNPKGRLLDRSCGGISCADRARTPAAGFRAPIHPNW